MRKLGDYKPYLEMVLKAIAERTEFHSDIDLEKVFAENPKLIVTANHSSPLSWLPAISMLTKECCERGATNRYPRGIMHKFFFDIPLLKPLAEYISQSDHFLGFEELIEDFKNAKHDADLVILPEGSNCFFGDPRVIQDFKSPRFLEIAIRVGCPVLIGVHEGSEEWGIPIKIHDDWKIILGFLPPKLATPLAKTGIFTIPNLPKRMKNFKMIVDLYYPDLKKEDLLTDETKLREQLWFEAEKMQNKMIQMQEKLKYL